MSGAPAKHKEWLNRAAEWLEATDQVVYAKELPNIIRRKDGRPFRNKPQPRGVFKRLQKDGRFALSYDGRGSHRKVMVRIKKEDE